MFKRVIFTLVLLAPISVWAFYKPIRVVAPELNGIVCLSNYVCVEDSAQSDVATLLYREALNYVEDSISKPVKKPKIVFCSTNECDKSFGLGKRAAYTLGIFGIIVSKRGWKPYYIRHEIIHHLQFETLGTIKAWLFTPEWFMEGMPYYLSKDPRSPLSEPFETAREDFKNWYHNQKKENIWISASNL